MLSNFARPSILPSFREFFFFNPISFITSTFLNDLSVNFGQYFDIFERIEYEKNSFILFPQRLLNANKEIAVRKNSIFFFFLSLQGDYGWLFLLKSVVLSSDYVY